MNEKEWKGEWKSEKRMNEWKRKCEEKVDQMEKRKK